MDSLQHLKEQGRILCKYVNENWGCTLTLSQAYEAVAAMQKAADWNTLLNRYVIKSEVSMPISEKQTSLEPSRCVTDVSVPVIRGFLTTLDGKATAKFDAAPWFEECTLKEVQKFHTLMSLNDEGCGEDLYDTDGEGDCIAEYCSKHFPEKNSDLLAVYAYIKALSDVGEDCGGSDCSISLADVERWATLRFGVLSLSIGQSWEYVMSGQEKVTDIDLLKLRHRLVLSDLAQDIWALQSESWQVALLNGLPVDYILEIETIESALDGLKVYKTGKSSNGLPQTYASGVVETVQHYMNKTGYYAEAHRLREKSPDMSDNFKPPVYWGVLPRATMFNE